MRKFLFKKNQSLNTNTGGAGFTLIEIILTIAIMSIIIGTSYAALIHFSAQQSLNSAYEVVKNNLNLAKSLASSQVKNCTTDDQTLVGYQMSFSIDPIDNRHIYKIDSVCQPSSGLPVLRNARTSKLQTGITISSTHSPILFLVITGEVQDIPDAGAKITLTGNGSERSLTVFPNGRIE